MSWYIENRRLTHADLPDLIQPRLSPPYPPGIWYVENGRLTHSGLPPLLVSGAFTDCSSLSQVSIPRSVKSIGENAFAGTALRRVRIARDCTYFPTSFPEDCIVELYDADTSPPERPTDDEIRRHISDTVIHITATERTDWNGKLDSDSALTNQELEALLT